MNPNLKPGQKGRKVTRLGALTAAKVIATLVKLDGATVYDIADASGLSLPVIRGYLLAMHREGCVYIKAWVLDARGGATMKEWAIGEGKDAKRAPPKNRGEIERAYRQRKRMAALLNIERQPASNDERRAA